jgi:hypothetical protein
MDSDSDDDLFNYGPSGLSQTSVTSTSSTTEAVIVQDKFQKSNINEMTDMTTKNELNRDKIMERGMSSPPPTSKLIFQR